MSKRGKGEGTIYQRKDDRWVAELTLEDGKRKYFYASTQEDVIQKLQQAQFEMKQGVLATGPKQKVETFFNQWLEEIHRGDLDITSYIRYRSLLNNHILPAFGKMYLQKVTSQQIQAFYTKKLKEGQSSGSVKIMHSILNQAFQVAVKWHLVTHNPSQGVKVSQKTQRKAQSLTFEQAQHLLVELKGQKMEAFVLLALFGAMRHGELTALRWEDLDLEEGTVYIHRTASRQGRYKFIEGDAKTTSSERKIDILPQVCDALKEHQVQLEEIKRKAGVKWQERGLVFPTRTGNFRQADTDLKHFYKILEVAGLPKMRIHDLRHSAASIMVAMGVNPKMVQEFLGHSSFLTTMNIYSHVLPSMRKEATEKMKKLFSEPSER